MLSRGAAAGLAPPRGGLLGADSSRRRDQSREDDENLEPSSASPSNGDNEDMSTVRWKLHFEDYAKLEAQAAAISRDKACAEELGRTPPALQRTYVYFYWSFGT